MRVLVSACIILSVGIAQEYYSDIIQYLYPYRRTPTEPNYNETFFPPLREFQVNATEASEDQYPWVARVVHSLSKDIPHVCTAVCIEERIFITAARCLFKLKVTYTTVIYQNHFLSTIAFVVPSNPTKQSFDDIGFIVVSDDEYRGMWFKAELFDDCNRTDDAFQWFANLNLTEDSYEHKVVGYTVDREESPFSLAHRKFNLTELEVVVGIKICPEILIFNNLIKGFYVPCYHSCSVKEFKATPRDGKCSLYHGVEGGALLNIKTNKILGIATWGEHFIKYFLPVGFAVPNSKNFYEDYTCARKIKQDKELSVADGYYQKLCEDIN